MPKRPTSSVWINHRGSSVLLNIDEIYADDHPYVVAQPQLFEDIVVIGQREQAPVEQATAAPGERRGGPRR